MAEKHDRIRYERGKEDLRAYIATRAAGIEDPQEARREAREAIKTYQEEKGSELEQAAKRFKIMQRVEFIIGALVILQIGILFLRGEPWIMPLIMSTFVCLLAYIVVAFMDSRAKGVREDLRFQIQAARKAKLKAGSEAKGVVVEFD
jgi:hypothetical protein